MRKKLAVVQSQQVVEHYEGMLEAKKSYEEEVKVLNEKFESQKHLFEVKKRVYDSLQSSYNEDKKQKSLYELEHIREATYKLGQAIEEKAAKEETILLEGVFNKINAYIERYGAENGYDVIIGATLSGNILYANKATDVTDEIIKGLNNEYRNGK